MQMMKEFIAFRLILQNNFKVCPSDRKKMIPDANMYGPKVIMRTIIGTSMTEYICLLL